MSREFARCGRKVLKISNCKNMLGKKSVSNFLGALNRFRRSKILVQNSKFRIFTGGPGQCWHHLLAGNSPPHHDQLQSQLTLVTMLHHCSAQLVITAFYEAFSARGTLGQLFILQHQATIIFLTTHADSSGQIF